MTYIHAYSSPLGTLTIASDGSSLTGLWFEGQNYFMSTVKEPVIQIELPVFDETIHWLDLYFSGINPKYIPSLSLNGTPFQNHVWKILLEIPYGKTSTYGEIASIIARREKRSALSAQAVGNAVGHNPISLIIPCHRVIGKDGSLTGYAGGLERKEKLLMLEQTGSLSIRSR